MHSPALKTLVPLVLALAGTSAAASFPAMRVAHSKRFNYTGATPDVRAGSGPNGGEDWFNTGMDSGAGWTPPYMPLADVKHIGAADFYAHAGAGCQQYSGYFQAAAGKYGIDEAILAVIAMQESSCDASATGPTPGLMQVACENYPNDENNCQQLCYQEQPVDGDCLAINVDVGASVLAGYLDASGGNFIQAMGNYNGWFVAGNGLNNNQGITYGWPCSATALSGGNGNQNVDYLQQVLNGWLQGINVYDTDQQIGLYEGIYGTCGT